MAVVPTEACKLCIVYLRQKVDNTSQNQYNIHSLTAAPKAGSRREPKEDEVPVEKDDYSHEDLYACYSTVTSLSLMDTFQKYLLDCLASAGRLVGEFEVSVCMWRCAV